MPGAVGERQGWWLAAACALVFVVDLLMVATSTGLARWDAPVLEWMVAHRTSGLTDWWHAVTTVFGPVVLPVVVGVGCVLWWLLSRSVRRPVLLAVAMACEAVASLLLKAVIDRPRPPDVAQVVPGAVVTHSFPSGHTMGTAALTFGLLVLLAEPCRGRAWWWTGSLLAGAVTTLVALSRLYLGYHYLTDVVAGFAGGLVVVGLLAVVAARTRPPTLPPPTLP
ncbi:phosphatase PAP2 family protein [Luteimicrobium subarcticum]|uniref:Undecaprenyl-diphosphatase n=1 Tax=Luteimicrobium subarcticum TaxID=620910 RepID=A0A2M8WU95_9MICO|nr:phosphatase PAP2 family protein [Luteimicrobium subarcticum]PJI94511.1 undecaprenyl-diphosphatase [Luteimicrobium subarcticum]